MAQEKKLGIWMDHETANLMEFTRDPIETKIVESEFTHEDKAHTLSRSEKEMHNKEQHEEADYYKKLGQIIRGYSEVLLFGPTDAKVELFNSLKDDHNFEHVKVHVIKTDKMTKNQQHAFVRNHFSKHL